LALAALEVLQPAHLRMVPTASLLQSEDTSASEVVVVAQRSAVLVPDSLGTMAALVAVARVATLVLVVLQQPAKVTLAALASLLVVAAVVVAAVLPLLVRQV
jgi:hypothetical protein